MLWLLALSILIQTLYFFVSNLNLLGTSRKLVRSTSEEQKKVSHDIFDWEFPFRFVLPRDAVHIRGIRGMGHFGILGHFVRVADQSHPWPPHQPARSMSVDLQLHIYWQASLFIYSLPTYLKAVPLSATGWQAWDGRLTEGHAHGCKEFQPIQGKVVKRWHICVLQGEERWHSATALSKSWCPVLWPWP